MTNSDDRARDARLHELLYRVPIEWRDCWRDPEYGEWYEVQSQDELLVQELGHVPSSDDTTKQPCYNRLDTDGPRKAGWKDEDRATADRDSHWRVVPFYGSDWRAAGAVLEQLRLVVRPSVLAGNWGAGKFERVYLDGKVEVSDEMTAPTGPRAVREAAIRALEE